MRKLLLGAVLAGGFVLLAGAGTYFSLGIPYAGFSEGAFVNIPAGTSSVEVSRALARAGVARHSWQFLLARALRPNAKIQAGEYYFREPATVWHVFDRLSRGDVFYHELTVPEGHNMYDIADSLDRLGVISGESFLRAAGDPSLVRDLAPEAPSLEGYLFPDTYRITRQTTAEALCSLMTGRFRKAWRELGTEAPVHRTVTLASLVEKETSLDAERRVIASVFRNRLRLGMSLDCDPTTIYAALLENRYRGAIYRSDLQSKNRYNTYQHPGLPPGAIANPGMASLEAALRPADTGYLYFVARPDASGGHEFSAELKSHQRAVQRYRRANSKEKQTQAPARTPGPGATR